MGIIKQFCSLGTLCHTARMMQRIHVKNTSYPFDWMFTDEEVLIDILGDDFNKFMDKSYYGEVAHKFGDRCAGHSLYHEDFFFHKNPRNQDDYEYYQRCIDRFKGLLVNPEMKLFITFYAPQLTTHPKEVYKLFARNASKDEIINDVKVRSSNLNNILMNHTFNYKLLTVLNFGGNTEQSFNMDKNGNMDFLTLNTISHSNGVEFQGNNDNLFFSGIMCEHYL